MGVPAGPKLDFVGASEVRYQENQSICIALEFVLAVPCNNFYSPLTKPKRKLFDLQHHCCEDTTF